MATIDKHEILQALTRLGELAAAQDDEIELVLVGGALMVLLFGERQSTRDVDVLISTPEPAQVRALAKIVAMERSWPEDWLNDAAKGYLVGISQGDIVFHAPGIRVTRPSIEQLLAMKLSAWRDELDIGDARRLLQELSGNREEIWKLVSPYLFPGTELKAKYALEDLWESIHGQT